MAQLVKSNGEVTEVKPANGKKLSLKEMQDYVGGYIEVYRTKEKAFVWNEDGLNMGLPENETATVMLYAELDGFNPIQVIVGNVLICDKKEFN